MKKFIIVVGILLAIWFYKNPWNKIGILRKNFIIYSGFPSPMNIMVTPDSFFPTIQDKLTTSDNKIRKTHALKQIFSDPLNQRSSIEIAVIGKGMGENLYTPSQKLLEAFRGRDITIYKGPTKEMKHKYNSLISQNKNVLGLFVVKGDPEDL